MRCSSRIAEQRYFQDNFDRKLVFAGFKRIVGYAGSMTFKAATADENGELIFEELSSAES